MSLEISSAKGALLECNKGFKVLVIRYGKRWPAERRLCVLTKASHKNCPQYRTVFEPTRSFGYCEGHLIHFQGQGITKKPVQGGL
jgi:hypothetical protein